MRPGRRRRRRRRSKKWTPRNSWMQEVTTGIKEKGIEKMGQIERKEWRRKTILQARKNMKTFIHSVGYMNKNELRGN